MLSPHLCTHISLESLFCFLTYSSARRPKPSFQGELTEESGRDYILSSDLVLSLITTVMKIYKIQNILNRFFLLLTH